MNFYTLRNWLFYTLRPMIPRPLQIAARRKIAGYKRRHYAHIWPIDPGAAQPPAGWTGWPDGKQFALVLVHDVDTRRGYDNCLKLAEIEEQLGFRSTFSFVPERYGTISLSLLEELKGRGFDIAVHGLKHDGKLFRSKKIFDHRAVGINHYLKKWQARGFSSPSMHHNLEWLSKLDIDYSVSTFDTDPFEPQPDAVGTIFPFWVPNGSPNRGFVELPHTLSQDSTMFVILQEKGIDIWKRKLDWIAAKGGMALVNTHADYMDLSGNSPSDMTYPIQHFINLLEYIKYKFTGAYYHATPQEIAPLFKEKFTHPSPQLIDDLLRQKYKNLSPRLVFNLLDPTNTSNPTNSINSLNSINSTISNPTGFKGSRIQGVKGSRGYPKNLYPVELHEVEAAKRRSTGPINSTNPINPSNSINPTDPTNPINSTNPTDSSNSSAPLAVTLLDPETDPRWDQFVHDHPFGLIYHLSDWKKILENSFPHMKGYYFTLIDEGGNINAALPIYTVKSWLLGNRLVSIPFGTLGDPLISDAADLESLMPAVMELYRESRSNRIEIRTLNSIALLEDYKCGFGCSKYYKHHYLLLDREPRELKKQFHRKSVRAAINRSERSGTELVEVSSEKELKVFYSLYFATRKRLKLPPQPYQFIKNIWELFGQAGHFQILFTLKGHTTIAALAFYKFKKRISLEFSGWNPLFRNINPNHYLYWEAIKLGCKEGYDVIDFGRTSPKNNGLLTIKRRWGTIEIDLSRYYLPNIPATNEHDSSRPLLRDLFQSLSHRRIPDFVFSKVGNFCYRHLG